MATSTIKKPRYTKFGTSVDVSSYTESNKYIAPSDGFLYLYTNYRSGAYIIARVSNADDSTSRTHQVTGNGVGTLTTTAPVFKGQKIWVDQKDGKGGSVWADFIPYE